MESTIGYDPMSYLSSHQITPSAIYFREKNDPFVHWTVSSSSYPCSLYDVLLRVTVRKILTVRDTIQIYMDPESLGRWKTLESAMHLAVPQYMSSLHSGAGEGGDYLSVPANRESCAAVASGPSVLHLRVKWIYQTSYGKTRVLLYIYDGTDHR